MYFSDSASMSEDEGKIAPKQSAFALLMGDDGDDSDAAGSDSEKEQEEEAKPKAQEKAKKVIVMNTNSILIQH